MERINIQEILQKERLEKEDIIQLLQTEGAEKNKLFKYAAEIKRKYVGNKVYLRGLIEYSNICKKDCYYCGIRSSNKDFHRYEIKLEDVEQACNYAVENKFGSMVIQCGELQSNSFTKRISNAIKLIKFLSNGRMRITLSCGEQTPDVYKKWFEAGAERYLLRIESSNPALYNKIHPNNKLHDYDQRLEAIKTLKKIGFQTGTGVMIGLPFQTTEDLADDILFMRDNDIDMCGMGPYIEHENTPLFQYSDQLISLQDRYQLALKMIAILRIVMKNINIASTTALQAIDSKGKRSALEFGANVIMPNLTPAKYKSNYHLYQNKPAGNVTLDDELNFAKQVIENANCVTAFGEYGDSMHYLSK